MKNIIKDPIEMAAIIIIIISFTVAAIIIF
jgi:hypothetical protein